MSVIDPVNCQRGIRSVAGYGREAGDLAATAFDISAVGGYPAE